MIKKGWGERREGDKERWLGQGEGERKKREKERDEEGEREERTGGERGGLEEENVNGVEKREAAERNRHQPRKLKCLIFCLNS